MKRRVAHATCLLGLLSLPVTAQTAISVQASAPLNHGVPVFDPGRGIVVTFESTGRVWEWNGARWLERWSGMASMPSVFAGAWDPVRQRLTWITSSLQVLEWDGAQWQSPSGTIVPTLNPIAGAAFDVRRGRFVVLGAVVSEWDGNRWWTIAPAAGPMGRNWSAVAWDPVRQAIVCFGGSDANGALGDTWSWDGTSFLQITSPLSPSPRSGAALSLDPFHNRMLLYGGINGATVFNDTWALDLSGWTHLQPATNPGPRAGASLVQDNAGLLLSDGQETYASWSVLPTDPYWRWNGLTWQRLPVDAEPSTPSWAAATWDEARGELLLVTNIFTVVGPVRPEVWTWNGAWHRQHPTAMPQGAFAADPQRGNVVLFGGTTATNQTWTWNGLDWTQQQPVHSPPARSGHAMSYDRARNVVLLFGGNDGINVLGDFWQWNGTDWSQIQTAVAPAARQWHGMAYDEVRARTVLSPGGTMTGIAPDTCEWDGTSWLSLMPTVQVHAMRPGTPMTFDPIAGQVALQAGGRFHWTGTNWIVAPATGSWSGDLLVGDPLRQGLLNVPGASSPWTARLQLLTATPAAVTYTTGGCALGNAPGLGVVGRPVPGEADFHFEVQTMAGAAPAMLLLGLQSAQVPLGNGCVLMVGQPAVAQLAVASAGGWSEFRVPIPANPVLLGLRLSAQAAVLDPMHSVWSGITISSGVQITVGW